MKFVQNFQFRSPFLLIGALAAWSLLVHSPSGHARADEGVDFFEKKIRPVLVEKCYSCHSEESESVKGGLKLDTRAGIQRGGDSGPAVVPKDIEGSSLLSAIRYEDYEMPPSGPLPESVVADFEKWIAMGAPDPREGGDATGESGIDIEAGRKHWSFQPIKKPSVPKVKDTSWPRTDIDRFILAKLEEEGLSPVGDAEPHNLRRRIAFDLTGLPPDLEKAPESPAKQIDTLLASPQFGERWGRHWLDVARYGESSGSGGNIVYPLAYRYRDWVIDALNADKPYDEFLKAQLAGDLLPASNDADRDANLIAVGYLAVGIKDLGERNRHRYQMFVAEEQIDAVGRGLLGLTIACAKCHDHKYDPIPTADYYALAGILVSSEPLLGASRNRLRDPFSCGVRSLVESDNAAADEIIAELRKLDVNLTYATLALRNERWRILGKWGLNARGKLDKETEQKLSSMPSVVKLRKKQREIEVRYNAVVKQYDAGLADAAMSMRDFKPQDAAIHIRGEDSILGPVVPRGFPQVLTNDHTPQVDSKQSGRLELAEWIASEHNPLTARVIVNRVWQHLFATGLVESPDDFGTTGQPPSHPELLDYLAMRLIELDWSLKSLIGEIMNSRVYQLSCDHDEKAQAADPGNRLCWRMTRRRLDSDALLDTICLVGGDLNLERPSRGPLLTAKDMRVKTYDLRPLMAATKKSRTIYQPVIRGQIPRSWSMFDYPDPELVKGKRGSTTTPTQALFFMNGDVVLLQARRLAERLVAESQSSDHQIEAAFQSVLNRTPTTSEKAEFAEFLENYPVDKKKKDSAIEAVAALCHVLMCSAEFRYTY